MCCRVLKSVTPHGVVNRDLWTHKSNFTVQGIEISSVTWLCILRLFPGVVPPDGRGDWSFKMGTLIGLSASSFGTDEATSMEDERERNFSQRYFRTFPSRVDGCEDESISYLVSQRCALILSNRGMCGNEMIEAGFLFHNPLNPTKLLPTSNELDKFNLLRLLGTLSRDYFNWVPEIFRKKMCDIWGK